MLQNNEISQEKQGFIQETKEKISSLDLSAPVCFRDSKGQLALMVKDADTHTLNCVHPQISTVWNTVDLRDNTNFTAWKGISAFIDEYANNPTHNLKPSSINQISWRAKDREKILISDLVHLAFELCTSVSTPLAENKHIKINSENGGHFEITKPAATTDFFLIYTSNFGYVESVVHIKSDRMHKEKDVYLFFRELQDRLVAQGTTDEIRTIERPMARAAD